MFGTATGFPATAGSVVSGNYPYGVSYSSQFGGLPAAGTYGGAATATPVYGTNFSSQFGGSGR
jgi:hypothetical protein